MIVNYPDLLANAQEQDISSIVFFASGQRIQTTDGNEADAFQAQCMRLKDAGLVERVERGFEEYDGVNWHTFSCRVHPTAITYLAQLAKERLVLSRDPIA